MSACCPHSADGHRYVAWFEVRLPEIGAAERWIPGGGLRECSANGCKCLKSWSVSTKYVERRRVPGRLRRSATGAGLRAAGFSVLVDGEPE